MRSTLCLLLAASGSARAFTFCVDTASKLQQALASASDGGAHGTESSNVIRVVSGTYVTGSATGNAAFLYRNTTAGVRLELAGGYDAVCSLSKAATAVLDGNHATQVLQIHSSNGEVDVYGFTIQNGEYDQPGAGLSINYATGGNSRASVFDNIIRNNHTTNFEGGVSIVAAGSGHLASLVNNLIVGNSADFGDGAGAVIGNGFGASIFNNTVTQNTTSTSGANGGLRCGGSGSCTVINNIFWNNTTFGLRLSGNNADVEYNDYGTLGGNPPEVSFGNLSVTPRFIDASGGDFHLAGDSSLLGVSPVLTGIKDLDGHVIPTSGKIDLGAYEETIFIDGFDG